MSALAADIPALGVGRLALLGTGTVGSAFVQRYQALQARGLELPSVQWLANSRTALEIDRDLALPLELARRAPRDGQLAAGRAPKDWSVATWWSMPPPAKTWPRVTCSGWRAACMW
jgi:hypothetical protein